MSASRFVELVDDLQSGWKRVDVDLMILGPRVSGLPVEVPDERDLHNTTRRALQWLSVSNSPRVPWHYRFPVEGPAGAEMARAALESLEKAGILFTVEVVEPGRVGGRG